MLYATTLADRPSRLKRITHVINECVRDDWRGELFAAVYVTVLAGAGAHTVVNEHHRCHL